MYLNKFIPQFLKQILFHLIIKNKFDVNIGRNCIIDNKSYYEGYNTLQDNVHVLKSHIGKGTYIANDSRITAAKIGRFCAIGGNVKTGFGIHPTEKFVSIHPAFYSLQNQTSLSFSKKQMFEEHKYIDKNKKYFCEIGNDVWIGNNVMIMDGVQIGHGAIVASGAIVTKNVAPYTIIGGIPAKEIKKRFTNEQIQHLLNIKWWNWDVDKLKDNADLFENIEYLLNKEIP